MNEQDRLPIDSDHYNDRAYFPNEQILANISEGNIYEVKLREKLFTPKIMLPEGIHAALSVSAHRKNLRRKMNYNMSLRFPITGLPSSAFAFIESNGKAKLHYLVENRVVERDRNPHDPMRIEDERSGRNQYSIDNLLSRQSLWSGHFATVTPEYQSDSISHIMLMDKFGESSDVSQALDKRIIKILLQNGILPITSEAEAITHF